MKTSPKHYLTLFGIAGIIVALDQWTKELVRTHIPLGEVWLPAGWENLKTYARIVHWYNTGAAFGIFQNGAVIFTGLAVIVSIAIIWFYGQIGEADRFLRIPLAMQLGGALGNLFDRLLFEGRVTDMISVGNFAVFNIADASISVGTAIMLIGIWWMEMKEKEARKIEERKQTEATSDSAADPLESNAIEEGSV